MNVNLIET